MNKLLLILLLLAPVAEAEIFSPIQKIESYEVAKVALGKALFFDKQLSKDGTISCASCHSDYGSDNRVVSIGVNGEKGNIQSLTVFNSINNYKFFWNGRASSLQEQIDFPIHSPIEMGSNIKAIETYLRSSSLYKKMFQAAFSQEPSYKLLKQAIVEFEATLVTPNSRFDQFLSGQDVLTNDEKKGLELFKDYGCAACHNGINIGGNSMQVIGSVIPYPYIENQLDLYAITQKEQDKNVFRVPSLRNITKTAPYFHDASAITLEAAIIKMAYHNLGMILNQNDIDAIKMFLGTLEGEIPLTWRENVQ